MVFSTPLFMFCFLVLTLLVYYLVPRRARNVVLLLSSLLFYFWGEQIYVVIMFLSTAIDFTHGLLVERCKARGNDRGARIAVVSSVIFNLLLLGFFKYWNFLAGSFAAAGLDFMPIIEYIRLPHMEPIPFHLPIGISFYTFQTMSYTIDVYRGDARAQRNILNFGTFVTLFPQLIAGPIIKYKDMGDQINERTCSVDRFASGVQIFMVGLGKKLLIANNVGSLWDAYAALPASQLTVAGAWLGAVAYTLQIYFDFSGYSDMAIGLGRMLGFEFLPNFDHPFISQSITEFWRRWHISLGTWFREYLYIPLGGSRVGPVRRYLNILIVWAATGIWHGASWNFLLWGLYFGLILVLEKKFLLKALERLPRAVRHIYTLAVVVVSMAIFAITDFAQLGDYLKVMFGLGGVPLADGAFGYYLSSYGPILLIACAASTSLGVTVYRKMRPAAQRAVCGAAVAAGLVVCTAYVVASTYNPFLYFRF